MEAFATALLGAMIGITVLYIAYYAFFIALYILIQAGRLIVEALPLIIGVALIVFIYNSFTA